MLTEELRNEARLLLACARTRIDAGRAAEIRNLSTGPIDWSFLLLKAEQHRLTPLLYNGLAAVCCEAVPAPVMQQLRLRYRQNLVHGMLVNVELVALLKLFELEGIEVIPYKGPTLARAAYGDVALRQVRDLDLLVRREDVLKASMALAKRGYQPAVPLARLQLGIATRCNQELPFDCPWGPQVDLHWCMTPPQLPVLLEFDFLWKRLATIEIDGYPVRSLRSDDLLLYLLFPCIRHQWSSLAWLCDMAQVVDSAGEISWREIADRAVAQRYARTLRVAGFLVSDHLGVPVPPELQGEEEAAKEVLRLAFSEKTEEEASWGLRQSRARLLEPRDRCRFWIRIFFFPALREWLMFAFPRPLFFLYFLVRPWRLIAKYILRLRVS